MASQNLSGNPLVKDLLICQLCSKFFEDPRVLPCQHTFCLGCLQRQFQTSHASSRVRLSSIRCPSCFSAAAIPIRGIGSFPSDYKVDKVKELVESVMMTGLLRKTRVDILEGRTRSGSKSRPQSWTGNFDVMADGALEDELTKAFSGAQPEVNEKVETREVSTDTNDDTVISDHIVDNNLENCSNLQDCGIQTEMCDITKCIGYDKLNNKNNFDNSEMYENDNNVGRKRTRDITINHNGVSDSKRTCHDIDSSVVEDGVISAESGHKSKDCHVDDSSSLKNGRFSTHTDTSHVNSNHVQDPFNEGSEIPVNEEESHMDATDSGGVKEAGQQKEGDVNDEDTGSLNEDGEQLSPVYTNTPKLLWSVEKEDYDMPTSVVMTSNGNVVVGEYGNCKLQFFESDGHYMQSVDQIKPFALALDKESNIVVGDRRDRTVKVFHPLGELNYEWDKNSFHWISGIGVTSQGNYVIFDREDCKVGIFTPEGERIHQFGHYGDGDSQLCMADFLAVDAHDRILVCDSGHHCVKVFDLNGAFLGRFGERGTSDGYLLWPKSVCVDTSNNILVSDQKNSRISLYSSDGRFIQTITSTCNSPFNIDFKAPDRLAVTSFSLTGYSSINMYQI